MQVNLNCTNNNYNLSKKPKMAFTSVFPAKGFAFVQKEGKEVLYPVKDRDFMQKIIRNLQSILKKNPANMNDSEKNILDTIRQNIPDYHNSLKSSVNNYGDAYFFTGKEAEILQDAGKKFGPSKKEVAQNAAAEAQAKIPGEYQSNYGVDPEDKIMAEAHLDDLKKNYSQVLFNLKNNLYAKLRNKIGENIECHILAKPVYKNGQIEKYDIERISFPQQGTREPVIVRETENTPPQPANEVPIPKGESRFKFFQKTKRPSYDKNQLELF